MENNPFNPFLHCPYSRNRKASWHRGRAERKPTLSLELERGLFKLRADGPELDVLLKLDPRIGSHLYKCDCFPMYFYFCFSLLFTHSI